jgi:hypothetical protein
MSDGIDLNEWSACLTNGEWFCGKRNGDTLASLQKLTLPMGLEANEKGQQRPTISVLTYPWITDSIEVPKGALWIACTAFENHAAWAAVITSTERLKLEKRAKRVGLHLA